MRQIALILSILGLLAGCDGWPSQSTSTTVNCEGQAGASVKCPDKNFTVAPPPAELKQ